MGTMGTFDAFTSSRLGIYAAMHGLRVTGNNISNISTEGYTRQRIDQVSLKTGGADMYRSQLDNHVGNGALVTGINQIRDPYLDIRYRNTNADVGYTDTWLDGLKNIASILDEVGKGMGEDEEDGILYAQLQDLAKSLRRLSEDPNSDNDTLVRTSADALCNLFHLYSGKLETLRQNTETAFEKDLNNVNAILNNIRDLNEEIRRSEIHGDNALEMRDERNRQIDELSEYMHIKVVYTMEDIGAGQEVEKLTISLANDNPDDKVTSDSAVLIDGIYGGQLALQKLKLNPTYNEGDNPNTMYLDEDGQPCGEDDALASYDITVSKLYDSKGRLWTNPTTIFEPVAGTEVLSNATFRFELQTANWVANDTLVIAGTPYTIADQTIGGTGADSISVADANDPVKLAEIVAQKLQAAADAAGGAEYKVSSENGYIVFTAINQGAVGGDGPKERPTLTITDGGDKISTKSREEVDSGYKTVAPNAGKTEYDPDTAIKTEISYTKIKGQWFEIKTVTQYSKEVALDDNDLYGSLQATRELLTERGEFATAYMVGTEGGDDGIDENATSKRGIPYYQYSLDLLARQVADQYNKLNQGYMVNQYDEYIGTDNKPIDLGDGSNLKKGLPLTTEQEDYIRDHYPDCVVDGEIDMNALLKELGAKEPEGMGVLFSNRGDNNDPSGINAANINISLDWSTGDTKIIPTFVQLFGEDGNPLPNSTKNENANHMVTMIEEALVYDPKALVPNAAGGKLFQGGFNAMFSNMMSVQGKDQRKMNVNLTTSYGSLVELDSSREGVSGVDLNDEAMNMMQYQKAYSAACRMMTAIDEALDRLINNTGIAGR